MADSNSGLTALRGTGKLNDAFWMTHLFVKEFMNDINHVLACLWQLPASFGEATTISVSNNETDAMSA